MSEKFPQNDEKKTSPETIKNEVGELHQNKSDLMNLIVVIRKAGVDAMKTLFK